MVFVSGEDKNDVACPSVLITSVVLSRRRGGLAFCLSLTS